MLFNSVLYIVILALAVAQQQQQRYDTVVKNGTANAQLLTGFPPYGMPTVPVQPFGTLPVPGVYGPVPLQPQPFAAPILPAPAPPLFPTVMPPMPMMQPMQPMPPLEDNNVCTMDATVLVVIKKIQPVPIAIQPAPMTPIGASRDKRDINSQNENDDPNVGMSMCNPNIPGSCGNAVRIRCAETAVADELTCTTCCQMATKIGNFQTAFIRGLLIDSLQLTKGPMETIRKKRLAPLPTPADLPPPPPSCASRGAPCAALKCMCCGPRLPFPQITPLLPALPLQVAPLAAPMPQPQPVPLMPPPVPYGPMPFPMIPGPVPMGPMPMQLPMPVQPPMPPPMPFFPYTGQANPSAGGQKQV